MDDSGDEKNRSDNACVIGGFVGDIAGWDRIERYWPVILAEYGLSYLHMSEHASNKGLMQSTRGNGVPDILDDLLNLIRSCGLRAIANTVRIKDLNKFRKETGVDISIRALSIYIGMINIWQQYGNKPVEVKLDNFKYVDREICLANQYASSVKGWNLRETITLNRAPGLAKHMPAMQAADIIAWEARRHHSQEEMHLSKIIPLTESDNWRDWFLAHNRESLGNLPSPRNSMRKVLDEFVCFGSIIDYKAIMKIHEAREGKWGY